MMTAIITVRGPTGFCSAAVRRHIRVTGKEAKLQTGLS